MKMLYEKDANVDLIKSKKIAIFGFGSQGHSIIPIANDSGTSLLRCVISKMIRHDLDTLSQVG